MGTRLPTFCGKFGFKMATTSFFSQQEQDTASSRKNAKLFDTQDSSAVRKTLQTLQPSSNDGKQLVSKDGPVRQKPNKSIKVGGPGKKKTMIKQCFKPIEVFSDPSPEPGANGNRAAEQEALQLMGSEPIPDSYWKMLAEERRAALDDSLHENEQLHKEIEDLMDENSKLKEMAGQAEYLASILQTAIESSSDDEEPTVEDRDEKVESFLSSCEVISLTDEHVQNILTDEQKTCKSFSSSDLDEVVKITESPASTESNNVVESEEDGVSSDEASDHSHSESDLKKSNESSKTVLDVANCSDGQSPCNTPPTEASTIDS